MSRAILQHFFRLSAALAFTFAVARCGGGAEPALSAGERAESTLRIVSLSPALTRIAVDLGLAECIVGRTPFCASVDESVVVVGDHFSQDLETLVRLRPTHVLIQPPRNEVPAALAALAAAHDWSVLSWRIDTVEDVRAVVREMPHRLGVESDQRDELERRAGEVLQEIEGTLGPRSSPGRRGEEPSVLLVYSTDPVISVFGVETYLDEIIQASGWRNAASHVDGWGQLSLEDAVRLDADAIIVVAERAKELDEALGPLAGPHVRAVAEKRAAVLAHPEALLPSTSVIGVARELRAILESFEENEP